MSKLGVVIVREHYNTSGIDRIDVQFDPPDATEFLVGREVLIDLMRAKASEQGTRINFLDVPE